MHFSVQVRAAVTEEVRELAEDVGNDRVMEQLGSRERTTLVDRFSPPTRIREGDTIEVAVDERGAALLRCVHGRRDPRQSAARAAA